MRTEPTHPADRLRALVGAVGFVRRRAAKALRRMRDEIESGSFGPGVEVAGGSRVATGVP
jgi:hypothetical protein